MLKRAVYFFYTVSRGYSLPTSFTSWLVCFVYCLKNNGNITNGIIALVGITFAHLGTNLLDDCIDTICKVPKQKCKTEYLDKGLFTLKFIVIACMLYFLIAFASGVYLFMCAGIKVLFISLLAAIIMLLYPRLNHYALGEAAIALTYGILLFSGVSIVMIGVISFKLLLISVPVSLLIMNLLYAHSLMDYDFDNLTDKRTLCIRLGSKERALTVFLLIGLITILSHVMLVYKSIFPIASLLILVPVVLYYIRAYVLLKNYIKESEHKTWEFMGIFKYIRNSSIIYNILITLIIFMQ